MIRLLGLIFALILIEIPILIIDHFVGNGFLTDFMKNQSLTIMGTLLGLNIASSIFLVGYLTNIESIRNKQLFTRSKKEIKQNIYLMIIIFLLQLIVLVATPSITKNSSEVIKNTSMWEIRISLFLFLFYFLMLYEMTSSIFLIDKNIKQK